ncbi:MAG: ATP-binding protein [Nannocystaceae bacterium]
MRILVVEDNLDLAENVAELLEEDIGAEVVVCTRALGALERAGESTFDLAFVDVRLPDLTGVELVPRLRACTPGCEFILITGNASLDTAIAAVREGVFAYVQKPFELDDLVKLARRALAQVQLRQERQHLAAELARSEKCYRGVVETVDALIVGVDRESSIQMWNRAATAVTGYPAEAVTGHNFIERLIDPQAQARFGQLIKSAWAGHKSREFQAQVLTSQGKRRLVRWSIDPLVEGEDSLGMLLLVGTDVTERLDLERRAADAEAMASLGALTAGLAHEIRNPLNAAGLQLELLDRVGAKLDSSPSRDRLRNSIGLVRNETRRLSRLLEDFLRLARPRNFDLYPLDLGSLITDMLSMQRLVADAAGVEIHVEVPEELPQVLGDRAKLTQVLINLVVNAIDALRAKSGGRIDIRAAPGEDGYVCVEIIDDGAGLGAHSSVELFRPFVSTKETGTGLGLAIVKRIVDLHRGVVELEPHEGGGTLARIKLLASGIMLSE